MCVLSALCRATTLLGPVLFVLRMTLVHRSMCVPVCWSVSTVPFGAGLGLSLCVVVLLTVSGGVYLVATFFPFPVPLS